MLGEEYPGHDLYEHFRFCSEANLFVACQCWALCRTSAGATDVFRLMPLCAAPTDNGTSHNGHCRCHGDLVDDGSPSTSRYFSAAASALSTLQYTHDGTSGGTIRGK